MIVHHTEMDATLWDDYASRHPILQKNLYHWNLRFCILFMLMLIVEVVLMTSLLVVNGSCTQVYPYVGTSYLSVVLALGFGILCMKWNQCTLYYASAKSRHRANIKAVVLLVGVMVPLIGSYFFVWEGQCSANGTSKLVLAAFAIQMIRTPMTLSIQ